MRIQMLSLIIVGTLVGTSPAFAEQGFVVTDDGAWIHYTDSGPAGSGGPSLLFVPGWTMPGWIWEPQLEHFGERHRVVAMDPRAQGQSSQETEGLYPVARAGDIRAVVEDLDLEPVVLVGWSMGVTEVLSYVQEYGSDGIAGLVLVDGGAGIDMDSEYGRSVVPWLMNFQVDRAGSARLFVRSMYVTPQEEAYLERVTKASLRTPTSVAVALAVGSFGTDNRPMLETVDRPTLFVAAPGPFAQQLKQQADRIPGCRWVLMEDAGHALFVDQAERFNQLLEEFVKGMAGG